VVVRIGDDNATSQQENTTPYNDPDASRGLFHESPSLLLVYLTFIQFTGQFKLSKSRDLIVDKALQGKSRMRMYLTLSLN